MAKHSVASSRGRRIHRSLGRNSDRPKFRALMRSRQSCRSIGARMEVLSSQFCQNPSCPVAPCFPKALRRVLPEKSPQGMRSKMCESHREPMQCVARDTRVLARCNLDRALAQINLRRATCTMQLTRCNLHRATCAARLRRASCTEQLGQSNRKEDLLTATCVGQLADSDLRKALA